MKMPAMGMKMTAVGKNIFIENGKQSDLVGVSMPLKIGEVLAAMHISLVQRVVKMFLQAQARKSQSLNRSKDLWYVYPQSLGKLSMSVL